jgi:hypothetical protein
MTDRDGHHSCQTTGLCMCSGSDEECACVYVDETGGSCANCFAPMARTCIGCGSRGAFSRELTTCCLECVP